MTNEEIIRKAKAAKDPKELAEILKASGVGEMTEEAAGKLYRKYVSHELSDDELNASGGAADEELDSALGGCAFFDKTVCTACQSVGHFRTIELQSPDGKTSTIQCLKCKNTMVVPYPEIK